MPVRVMLLQARLREDLMMGHEVACFVSKTGLPAENVVPHDLCEGPPRISDVRRFDALMVGGSGDFYVSKGDLPQHEQTLDLLRDVTERGHPMFASCFGYQMMVVALGGEVRFEVEKTEVGTFELELSPEGSDDELFGLLPDRFAAQMGHKDRAVRLPDALPNLAVSERCPFQALRIPGRPIWATQFHPELDRQSNRERYDHYLEGYSSHLDSAQQDGALSNFGESPETSRLLPRFLDLVFG